MAGIKGESDYSLSSNEKPGKFFWQFSLPGMCYRVNLAD